MSKEMWNHYGFDRDPILWADCYRSADVKAIERGVEAACENRAWISVCGSPGSGKSFGLENVLDATDCHLVPLLAGDRRCMSPNQIDESFFFALGSERGRRSREARRRQLRRVLGEAAKLKPIILYLDEATRIGDPLMSEIKFLRDSLRFGSDPRNRRRRDPRPLFGVVMVGWHRLTERIKRSSELRPRIKLITMKGFGRQEVHDYVEHLGLKGAVPKRTRDAIADRCRYPLAINERLQVGLERAWLRGDSKVNIEDCSLDESDLFILAKQYGVRNVDVAKATGLSKGCVSAVMNGRKVSDASHEKVSKYLTSVVQDSGEADAESA